MQIERRNGINFYCFQNLSSFPQIYHGITTRQGGGSRPPFDSLNMAQHVGDSADQVAANRQRAKPVFLNQVHSRTVAVWDGVALKVNGELPGEADAVVTDRCEWLLTILVADCQPVMLYDPVRAVIANVHSGWRGSIADIIGRTVTVMKDHFRCNPAERKSPNPCGPIGCRITILTFGP